MPLQFPAQSLRCISFEIHNTASCIGGDTRMAGQTSMLHVRVDDKLKTAAAKSWPTWV